MITILKNGPTCVVRSFFNGDEDSNNFFIKTFHPNLGGLAAISVKNICNLHETLLR